MTLTELLVAMALSTMLGAITMTLFARVNDSSAATTDRTIDTSQARNALRAWTGYLHVSDGPAAGSAVNRFEWFTASSVLFYADLNNRAALGTTNPPTMIWLRLDGAKQFVEELFPATPGHYPAAPASCRTLASNVSTPKLFTPYDVSGADLTGNDLGAAPTVPAGCQMLPSAVPSQTNRPDQNAVATLQNVASVAIDFTIADTRNSHPLEFSAVATLPVLGGAT